MRLYEFTYWLWSASILARIRSSARRHVGGGKKLAKQLAAQDSLKQIIPQFFIER